jgi:hypothetical protein
MFGIFDVIVFKVVGSYGLLEDIIMLNTPKI